MQVFDEFYNNKNRQHSHPDHGGTTDPGMPSVQSKFKPHPKHPSIALGGGTLLALSGVQHTKELERKGGSTVGLHVMLEKSYYPLKRLYVSGSLAASQDGPRVALFPMADALAPDDSDALESLLTLIEDHLAAGETVAISCWGGHGRTGTIVALLWGRAHPDDPDPIASVRTAICEQEVETFPQEDFIQDYFDLQRYDHPIPATQSWTQPPEIPLTSSEESDWTAFIKEFDDEIARLKRDGVL